MSTPSLLRWICALIIAVASLGAPGLAAATCLNQCEAHLMTNTCTKIDALAPGEPVVFWISCQTCCAAPGGPVNCSPLDPYTLGYKLATADGGAVAGFVSPSAIGCPGQTGWALAFIPEQGKPLPPGSYQLIQDSMILVEFKVVASDPGPDTVDSGDVTADAVEDAAGLDAGAADVAATDSAAADTTTTTPPSAAGKSSGGCSAAAGSGAASTGRAPALLAFAALLVGWRRRQRVDPAHGA